MVTPVKPRIISATSMSKDSPADYLAATEPSMTKRLSKESENRYRRFVEDLSSEYIFYAHDRDGFFTYVSPSVLDVLGLHSESIIGLNWREIVSERYIGKKMLSESRLRSLKKVSSTNSPSKLSTRKVALGCSTYSSVLF
jgi:PAS domain S-box-containing protein